MRAPQPLQSCAVEAGGTATSRRLAPGACCLGLEDGPDLRPARVAAALGEVVVPHQGGDPHVFEKAGVGVAPHQQRRCVVEIGPLARHRLLGSLQVPDGLPAAVAALRAVGDAARRFRQPLRTASMPPRVLY
jgi:hypothetical protein